MRAAMPVDAEGQCSCAVGGVPIPRAAVGAGVGGVGVERNAVGLGSAVGVPAGPVGVTVAGAADLGAGAAGPEGSDAGSTRNWAGTHPSFPSGSRTFLQVWPYRRWSYPITWKMVRSGQALIFLPPPPAVSLMNTPAPPVL